MIDSTPLKFVLQSSDGAEPWVINQKVFDILNNCLQPGATILPLDAAKNIDKLFPLNRPKEDDIENENPASFLLEMWSVVIAVAEQIPWTHPAQNRLVEIIQALKDLPGSKTLDLDDWGKLEIWSGLPLLGPAMTEHSYHIDLEDSSELQKIVRDRQQNFVAFAAHLTRSGLADRSKHFAIQDFREALEQEPDPRSKAYHQQGVRLDMYIPLAAIWILLSGHVIFAHCRSTTSGQGIGGKNWKGDNGYSMERWDFWKKRVGEIKVHNQANEDTKKLASQVEDVMNKIEAEAT